jgi:hypothetical protein
MTPVEIQAAFAAQLEFNRQIQQQLAEDRQAAQAEWRQAAEERQQLRENLATLTDISIDFMRFTREAIARLDQTVTELRAANQRQERINDFLLRERGLNGG